jgi:hypothetical protein
MLFKRNWLLKVKLPEVKLPTGRNYKCLSGLPDSKQKGWSKPIFAKTAEKAVIEWWQTSRSWTNLDYEQVYCVENKEFVFVKTEYPNDHTIIATLLDSKPKKPPKII